MRGSQFDAASDPHESNKGNDDSQNDQRRPRPFLGIQFSCCNMYARIYRSPYRACYEGRCPRCGRLVRVPIGPGGTGKRFFTAGE